MDEVKRSVDCTARDFLAAWGRGDAGPVPCGACTACCHYPAIVIDEKLDARRLAHLRTEGAPIASWCFSGARMEPAFIWERRAAPSMSSGLPFAVPSTAASLPRWG